MALRIAVASSDGKFIDEHFGMAHCFWIYELDNLQMTLMELREIRSPHDSGELITHETLYGIVEQLVDCRIILAVRVGRRAAALLRKNAIEFFEVSGSLTDCLEKLAHSLVIKKWVRRLSSPSV